MGKSYTEIVELIDAHLKKSGRRYYSEFYIGVSQNATKRLFEEHHVDMKNSWWIYATADSSEIAKEVEEHYLGLGMRGNDRDENNNSTMVYSYVVTPTTTE
ncbi:MAG: hypothetical protein HDS01_03585 [Bacteroides sp.]|nr:hypothetical protein [Bacteroides sp.]